MVKKRMIAVFILLIVLLSILIANRYIQYILVWQAIRSLVSEWAELGGFRC